MKSRYKTVCDTCRARKLGCDGKRPACSQCCFSNRECPGYDNNIVFVAPCKAGVAKRKPPQKCRSARTRANHAARNPQPSMLVEKVSGRIFKPLSWPLMDIVSLCIQNFVPTGLPPSPRSCTRICGQWIEVLPFLVGNNENQHLLSESIKALGMAIVAHGPGGVAPACEAVEAQLKALRIMQSSINKQSVKTFSGLAASIMCLFFSEKLLLPLSTTATNAAVHVGGLGDLVQSHNPTLFTSGLCRELFFGFTPMLVLNAFQTRTATFLSRAEWRNGPLSKLPATPLHDLLSRVSVLPSILQEIDVAASRGNDELKSLMVDAIKRLKDVLHSLDQWYQHALSQSPELSAWHVRIETSAPNSWFPNITIASYLTHLWAFRIICLAEIRKLRCQYPELQSASGASDKQVQGLDCDYHSVLQMSSWILRSTSFFTRDKMKLYGSVSISFPIQTVCKILPFYDRTVEELADFNTIIL